MPLKDLFKLTTHSVYFYSLSNLLIVERVQWLLIPLKWISQLIPLKTSYKAHQNTQPSKQRNQMTMRNSSQNLMTFLSMRGRGSKARTLSSKILPSSSNRNLLKSILMSVKETFAVSFVSHTTCVSQMLWYASIIITLSNSQKTLSSRWLCKSSLKFHLFL